MLETSAGALRCAPHCVAQRMCDRVDRLAPIARRSGVRFQTEGSQGIRGRSAIAKHARTTLPSHRNGFIPLQRIDVLWSGHRHGLAPGLEGIRNSGFQLIISKPVLRRT